MADDGRHVRVVEIAGDEDGGIGIGVVVADDQLEARPLMPPVALISSAASSAACRIGRPIGSLNEPATPMRTTSAPSRWHPASNAAASRQSAGSGRK